MSDDETPGTGSEQSGSEGGQQDVNQDPGGGQQDPVDPDVHYELDYGLREGDQGGEERRDG